MPERESVSLTTDRWASWRRFLVMDFLIWTALAILLAIQNYYNLAETRGKAPHWNEVLWLPLARYWIYAALTPGVFWLARRSGYSRGRRFRPTVLIALGFVAFQVVYVILRLAFYPPVQGPMATPLPRTFSSAVDLTRSSLFEQLWMYASVVVVGLTLHYYEEARNRELREAMLRTRFAEYELQILKLQLHPHFLFNTLNGISALMAIDVKTAQEMILRLSDLLRIALSHSSSREISLREEIDFVEGYLNLEQMRFGARLKFLFHVSPETLDALLPNMVLQPLVENAVRHGIAARREGGTIEIETSRREDMLFVTITNDGPPLTATASTGRSGVGLDNTRNRLLQLYGSSSRLEICNRRGRVEVSLEVPFHETVGEERTLA